MDETAIEIGESEEGLDILHFLGLWPFSDGLYLHHQVHCESLWRKQETQVLNSFSMEKAFPCMSKRSVGMQAPEFLDMLYVHLQVVRIEKDVVEVDDHELI